MLKAWIVCCNEQKKIAENPHWVVHISNFVPFNGLNILPEILVYVCDTKF